MNARDVLELAEFLLLTAEQPQQVKPSPAALCRSAASRGYYALYLHSVALLNQIGFERNPARSGSVHFDLANTMSHAGSASGVVAVRRVANVCNTLSGARKDADYDLGKKSTESVRQVRQWLDMVRDYFASLDSLTPTDLGQLATAVDQYVKAQSDGFSFRRKK